ncbi:hypothetical protein HYDPIDRAFT_92577 [Hydnomerulius pinastri MD-312]|uniref:DUF6699 domain-containing protein n=1 Tax=Hydnomerulius pinastri MD-312 TaxID=994086 RepID=A0A0C9VCJ4_9AGAM|nr:hypothetical protein HYDPIDRAFT_92577 [Hydnomerulius pinastri MD-312]
MTPNAFGAGHTPWQHPTQPPPPAAAPPNDTARAAFRWTTSADRMDPFTEGPNYGPVLEPFLVKVVGANVKLNPLLSPPSDTEEDYLRWNMLFHTSNCYRTSESRRSWVKGRKAPATHPRLTHVRIVSRTFPWMIHARARDPKIGVTCGEVLDAISAYLHGDVAKKEYEHMPQARKRFIWSSYQHNRSTDPNVPGGGLGEALKRLDWLGQDSRFGGLVVNSDFVKEHCGDILPCTFELKCVSGRTMAQQGSREQPSRQHHPSRRRSSSRPRSLGGSAEEEEEEEE